MKSSRTHARRLAKKNSIIKQQKITIENLNNTISSLRDKSLKWRGAAAELGNLDAQCEIANEKRMNELAKKIYGDYPLSNLIDFRQPLVGINNILES